jgi:hypothetical protein
MELEDNQKDIERLLTLLEEVRLLLVTALPRTSPPRKQLSWDDVWRNASYSGVVRPSYVMRPKKSQVYELI